MRQVLFAVGTLVLANVAYAGELVSAGYEVVLTDTHDGRWQVQTTTQVPAGQAIQHAFGRYVLAMTVEPKPDGRYTLHVTVRDDPAGTKLGGVVLERAFAGTLGGILEFEAATAAIRLTGAIAAQRLKP